MITTKEQLVEALKNKQKTIVVGGELAAEIRKMKMKENKRTETACVLGGLTPLCGLIAAPFTMGSSIVASAAAATTVTTGGAIAAGGAVATGALALTIGDVVISTQELMIICGAAVAITGILKNYSVKFNSDGSVVLTMQQ